MTTRSLIACLLALVALLLMLPAVGHAQGNSGADQYREGVPTGGGETPTENLAPTDPTPRDSNQQEGSVADDTRKALTTSAGIEGRRLADLADATAPKRSEDGRGGKKEPEPAAATDGPGAARSRAALAAGPGGLGWGMPALMALGLVAALAYRFRNRPRTGPSAFDPPTLAPLVGVILLVLLAASPAQAERDIEVGFADDVFADNLLFRPDDDERASGRRRLAQDRRRPGPAQRPLGPGRLASEPADATIVDQPAYDWTEIDRAVRARSSGRGGRASAQRALRPALRRGLQPTQRRGGPAGHLEAGR